MSKAYSPLSEDKDTVKEFNIPQECELPIDQKLAFLQAQRQEMLQVMWRERVNVLHALRLQKDDNEALRNKGFENITSHKNMVRQMVGGIKTIDTLIKELEAEA